MCDIYANSDEIGRSYFNYMKFNLIIIKEMIERNKFSEEQLKTTIKNNEEIQERLNEAERRNDEQQQNLKELEMKIKQLQKKIERSEEEKNEIKQENDQIKKQLKSSEDEKNELQKRLEEETNPIKGTISASVKNGLLIRAQINISSIETSLDTSIRKYIVSSTGTKTVGSEAYEKGELITSLQMNTIDFLCRSGTYYVRCIIFDSNGKSRELVSNPVTTSGSNILFTYEGKPTKISLYKGKHKLEVWGAKGGDSGGTRDESKPPGKGGLGGYSCGVLTLNQNQIVHVYVGGEGKTASSSEGATTNGGFPDGGSTVTRHWYKYTTVPGTGGGSSSVRIEDDTDFSRVIVAGGSGGGSGDYGYTDHGGYGGGLIGGNCYYGGKITSKGSGTQEGSTYGYGAKINGDPGSFGHGATGKCYIDRNSGGGGGGGWYRGGGGGCGNGTGACSSGGGGSGWIFTETNFSTWQSGDPSNSSKFLLNNQYYLTDAHSATGNDDFPRPDGNGTEKGHIGNGYAKITPQ